MTEKDFTKNLLHDSKDILQLFLDLLSEHQVDYCIIGGLAVNAYVEPVVSLDLDIVIAAEATEDLTRAAGDVFSISRYPHSINLHSELSDLRIQIQTDVRYQAFIGSAAAQNILGYEMNVASIENVLQGKIWAYCDEQKRQSKRQKDLADIMRLTESFPNLAERLPESIKAMIV